VKNRLLLVLAVATSTGACAWRAPVAGPPSREVVIERAPSLVLIKVPYAPDERASGGPAALAGVMNFYERAIDAQTLGRQAYLPPANRNLPFDPSLASRAHGLRSRLYSGGLDYVKIDLRRGRPLIVLLDLGFGPYKRLRYAILTGYDDSRRGFFVHTGKTRYRFLSYRKFARAWEKTARWTLLVQPPEGEGPLATYGYY
jgi:hypothetical protein